MRAVSHLNYFPSSSYKDWKPRETVEKVDMDRRHCSHCDSKGREDSNEEEVSSL